MIQCGDCIPLLAKLPAASADLIFTDPPYNIGRKYGVYNDNLTAAEYTLWMRGWISSCYRILKPTGTIYVVQGDEYAAETKIALDETGFHFRRWIVWYYTFGICNKANFNRCHAHIFYYTKSQKGFNFRTDGIKTLSARQIKYRDKRAKSGGKLPDDVWTDSRVCGSFKERIKKADGSSFDNQLPESLVERALLASSNPQDLVVDPFAGTGTVAAVAKRLKRQFWTCDVDPECVAATKKRLLSGGK